MSASKFAMFWAVGVMMEARSIRPSPSMSKIVEQRPARGLGESHATTGAHLERRRLARALELVGSARRRQSAEQRSSTSTSSTAWAMLLAKGLYSGGRSPALAAA